MVAHIIRHRSLNLIKSVVAAGADIESTTDRDICVLTLAAGRELDGAKVMDVLLEAGATFSSNEVRHNSVLEEALRFFGPPGSRWAALLKRRPSNPDRGFLTLPSIQYILENGAGAIVMKCLAHMPEGQLKDARFGLLVQMAAVIGDYHCVKTLVQRGVDINFPNSYYGTAIQAAARFGNTTIVQYLLEAGADVNVVHGAYETAIRAAVRGDHFSTVKMLAGAGANVNLHTHQGRYHEPNARCVLQLAILNGNPAMVEALLSIGANVNPPGKVDGAGFFLDQTSPLHLAANKGHEQIARAFIRKVGESATPLEIAASRGFVGITQMLIEAGATIKGALRLACCYGHLNVVHLLLGTGAIAADTSQLYDSLNAACHMGRHTILDLLLTEVDLVSINIATCADILCTAPKRSDEKALLKVLDNSATLPVDALYQACIGYGDFIQETIHEAADRHRKWGKGGEAVDIAGSRIHPEILESFLSAAANLEPRDAQYGTPSVAALVQAMVAVRNNWKYEIPDELQKYISELIRLQLDMKTH
ncbi:MAG: hypothetical protein L6R36_005626 [Xanthoria steineri]|nr:MAG: hypothetical protein L6R36_005626 [Xanthoria steineri]